MVKIIAFEKIKKSKKKNNIIINYYRTVPTAKTIIYFLTTK